MYSLDANCMALEENHWSVYQGKYRPAFNPDPAVLFQINTDRMIMAWITLRKVKQDQHKSLKSHLPFQWTVSDS